jgi:hypothetical protein
MINQRFLFALCFWCISLGLVSEVSALSLPKEKVALFRSSEAYFDFKHHFSTQRKAVPAFLQPGQAFKLLTVEEHLKPIQNQFYVLEIPTWIYGQWQSQKQTQDFTFSYLSQKSNHQKLSLDVEVTDSIGDLQNADGQIFAIIMPGLIQQLNRSTDLLEYQIHLQGERLLGIGEFFVKSSSWRVQVERESQIITKVFQVESLKVYQGNYRNQLWVEGWLKSYDDQGQPISLSHNSTLKTLIKKHQLIDLEQIKLKQAQSLINK